MIDALKACQEFEHLRGERAMWESTWRDIASLTWPEQRAFQETLTPGQKVSEKIYDDTAQRAAEHGTAAMMALIFQGRWHGLRASRSEIREDHAVKEYFDEVTRILYAERARYKAAFQSAMEESVKSWLVLGTCAPLVEEDMDTEQPDPTQPLPVNRYQACPLSQVYLLPDGYGHVSGVFRLFTLPACGILERFGDRAPAKVREAVVAGRLTEPFDVLHVVKSRPAAERRQGTHRFDSALILTVTKECFAKGGYFEMPYMVGRYTVNARETYGRGPGWWSLQTNKTLQSMERTMLVSGQKVADPPLMAYADDTLGIGGRRISLKSGAVNYGWLSEDGKPLAAPLVTGARLDITLEMMNGKRLAIEEAYHVTFFRALTQHPDMTATQVMAILQAKGEVIAPPVARFQTEVLGPMIERELGLLERQGRLPEPPEILIESGGQYEIEYTSSATRIMRIEEAQAVSRWFEIMAPAIELDPSIGGMLKGEATGRSVAEVLGISAKNVESPEEFAERRKAMAEAQEAQQVAQAVPGMAQGVRNLAEAGSKMREAA